MSGSGAEEMGLGDAAGVEVVEIAREFEKRRQEEAPF